MNPASLAAARDSLRIEADAVRRMAPVVDRPEFAAAVNLLLASPRILTCASGHSGIAAQKFAHSLCCAEQPASFVSPCTAAAGGLGALQAGDSMVMVSRGGQTAELLPIVPVVRQRGARLLAVTENMDSPLASAADLVLPLVIDRESDPLHIMATSSFFATVALFDALLAAILSETGYTREQFAVIHPGGAVGQALNSPGA